MEKQKKKKLSYYENEKENVYWYLGTFLSSELIKAGNVDKADFNA